MKTYNIVTIEDIIKNIPVDKIDEFLVDFKNVILGAKLLDNVNPKLTFKDGFTWTDDGKREVNIIIDKYYKDNNDTYDCQSCENGMITKTH